MPSARNHLGRWFGRLQRSSHAALARDVSRNRPPASRSGRIDAIIVPASRGATDLDAAANLSVRLATPLLVLCSREADHADAATHLDRKPGCRALVVDVPRGYRHDLIPTRTSAPRFHGASAGRTSDLSLKRNIGLLMARYNGWGKILFLDDDIGDPTSDGRVGLPLATVRNLAHHLDSHQVAGLACRSFPDNSVVNHARRLAGFRQGTFITGAALGVNCNDQPLPFFPDVYNEDWFFFSRMAARRDVAHAGFATQARYDPFAAPGRAREEEFGDVLAEGLYAHFQDHADEGDYFRRLAAADSRYWDRFIADRRSNLHEIVRRLTRSRGWRRRPAGFALTALAAAEDQLSVLTPGLCTEFLSTWAEDLRDWERAAQRIDVVSRTATALGELGLDAWVAVGPTFDSEHTAALRPVS